MSGNRNIILGVWLSTLAASPAWACPACQVSNNQNSQLITLLSLAAMGLLPIALGIWVGSKILRIIRNEQRSRG